MNRSTAEFDPYYKWLGISLKDQPPHHYRLLGIDLFESDPEVIDTAANKQMTYLQACAMGDQVAHSQRLLNEVAAARLCLLRPERKKEYDCQLKANLSNDTNDDISLTFDFSEFDEVEALFTADGNERRRIPNTPPPPPSAPIQAPPPLPEDYSSPAVEAVPSTAPLLHRKYRPRRQKSNSAELWKSVVGGLFGLCLGYSLLCWIEPRFDLLGIRSQLSLLPKASHSQASNNSKSSGSGSLNESRSPSPPDRINGSEQSKGSNPSLNGPRLIPQRPQAQGSDRSSSYYRPNPSPRGDSVPAERQRLAEARRDAALFSGDIERALIAVKEIAELNQMDELDARFEFLMSLPKDSSIPKSKLASALVALMEEALISFRSDIKDRYIDHVLILVRSLGDYDLQRRATLAAVGHVHKR